jgi:hypothetical protein
MEKTGVIDLLRAMCANELYLFGDPSGYVPLFLLPLRLRRPAGRPKLRPVEAVAQYCAELLDRGLIESMTAGVASGDRRFQISDRGRDLMLSLDRR